MLVLALCCCVFSGLAIADEVGVPRTKPVNLQVLPRDLSGAKLGKLMKQFTKDLGVECSHCHAQNPETHKLDYVSDDVPAKQAARVMITMINDINEKYTPKLVAYRSEWPARRASPNRRTS